MIPLDMVIKFDYHMDMTASEALRKLKALGVTVAQKKKHYAVSFGGKTTTMPRHPAKEIKTGTFRAILKALGLKEQL